MPRFKQRTIPYSLKGAGGNAGFITCANSASLNPTAAVTLEIWFKPESYKYSFLFDNTESGVTASYAATITPTCGIAWYSTIGGISKVISDTTTKVKIFEWNFLNITYDGSAVKIFLNGSQLSETVSASGSLGTNSGQLRIGRYYALSGGVTFDGYINNPRVYSRGFTLADHQARFYNNDDSATMRTGLVLDLALSEGSGGTLADSSGQGNTGTMSGASWSTEARFKSRV